MRWFRFGILVLVAVLIQASLIDVIALTTIKLDLLLILLVFFSVYCETREVMITSFCIGFAADLIGPVMGPQIISFTIFGTLLAHLHRVISIRRMPYQSLIIALVGVLAGTMALILTVLKGEPMLPNFYTILIGTSLYSAIVGPFLFLPSAWWMRIKTHSFSQH
jgi:rod shape-determining protein MreD